MCRTVERAYTGIDGRRAVSEQTYPCERVRNGKLCSGSNRRPTSYTHKRNSSSRDDTPSPLSPATPTGSGTYLVQQRRPSGTGSRPTTREGHKEIIIEFGSKSSRNKKYPSISVSTKDHYRSSIGSVGSNDAAIESPSSEASYPIRTGYPEAPVPPVSILSQPRSNITTPAHGYHHSHTSSSSSFTGSSQPPSLYVTSEDYDPSGQRNKRHAPTIVHNPSVPAASSLARRQSGLSPNAYNTSIVTPHGISREGHTVSGSNRRDYADSADISASSYASSGAPEHTRRSKNSDERRIKEEDRRRQEELDEQENIKQVRFELGRPKARAQERAEKEYAEKQKERAAARDEVHRRKEEERLERERLERAELPTKERRREKSKPPTTEFSSKRPAASRRTSVTMTSAQFAEQKRLLAAEELRMRSEREATEAREREEEAAIYRPQPEPLAYYDPRGGDRSLSNNHNPTMSRRDSVTRHDSDAGVRSPGLTRTGSKRRTSISQPHPPALVNTQVPVESYSTRPPSSRTRAPPPLSFPTNFNQDLNRRPSSSRRTSFNQENPFAMPSTRGTGSGIDHPFSPTTSSTNDPWNTRTMQDTLPTPSNRESRYNTIQQRGEEVINRSNTHRNAQQATRAMGQYTSAFESDSDSQEDVAPIPYASRTGLSSKSKKKY